MARSGPLIRRHLRDDLASSNRLSITQSKQMEFYGPGVVVACILMHSSTPQRGIGDAAEGGRQASFAKQSLPGWWIFAPGAGLSPQPQTPHARC